MSIQEHAAHMCHLITTNYPQQMASDLRLIEIHSRLHRLWKSLSTTLAYTVNVHLMPLVMIL